VLPLAEQVALPILSRLRDDRAALARAYLGLTRLLALAIIPAAALLWVVAPWLVDAIYPGRWSAAVPALRALCIAAAAAGLNSDPGLLWIALGRLRVRLFWSIGNLAALVPVLWIGTRWGVTGVAYALAARSLVATAAAQAITHRLADVGHGAYARALLPGALLGAALAALGLL
jgi:PST family polysaccharide transporter